MFAQSGNDNDGDDGTFVVTIHAHPNTTSVLFTLSPFPTAELADSVATTLNHFYLAGVGDADLDPRYRTHRITTETTSTVLAELAPARCTECGASAVTVTPSANPTFLHLADCSERLKRIDIKELRLTNRAYNLLKREGIHTIGKLISKNRDDLRDIRNLGLFLLSEIEQKLAMYDPPLSLSAPDYQK